MAILNSTVIDGNLTVNGHKITIPKTIVLSDNTTAGFLQSDASGNISISNISDTNYYHAPVYTSSTNSLKLGTGTGVSDMYIPYATSSQAGIVTTGAQTIAGPKTILGGDDTALTLQFNSDETNVFLKAYDTYNNNKYINICSWANNQNIWLPSASAQLLGANTESSSTANRVLLSTSSVGSGTWSSWSTAGFLKTNASGVVSVDNTVVTGPSYSTANAIAVYNGTTGKTIQNSNLTVTDYTIAGSYGKLDLSSGLALSTLSGSGLQIDGTGNVRPTADNSINLGGWDAQDPTNQRRWKNLYLSGNLSDGTNSTTIAALIAGINSFAPTYSASSTYTVGQKVIYNGQLYKCSTTISTAEAWNSAHWTAIKVSSDFVDLDTSQSIAGAKTFATLGSINTNVTISGGYGDSESGYDYDAIGGLMLTGAASGLYGKATLLLAHADDSSSTSSPVKVYLPNKAGTLAVINADNNFSSDQTFTSNVILSNHAATSVTITAGTASSVSSVYYCDLPVATFDALYNYIGTGKTVVQYFYNSSGSTQLRQQVTWTKSTFSSYQSIICSSNIPYFHLVKLSDSQIGVYTYTTSSPLIVYLSGTDLGLYGILTGKGQNIGSTAATIGQMVDVSPVLYSHNITLSLNDTTGSSKGKFRITLQILNNTSDSYTTTTLATYLYNNLGTGAFYPAYGKCSYITGGTTYIYDIIKIGANTASSSYLTFIGIQAATCANGVYTFNDNIYSESSISVSNILGSGTLAITDKVVMIGA